MQPYQYLPLQTDHGEIRLVRLQPGSDDAEIEIEIFHATESSHPQYEALSYVWGDPTRSHTAMVKRIFNAHEAQEQQSTSTSTLSITTNLAVALEHLRYSDRERILWIDAICIDQTNSTERSAEVLRMDTIYSKAQNVIVWLGPSAENSSLAVQMLRKISQNCTVEADTFTVYWGDEINFSPEAIKETSKTWLAIKQLALREYFSRLWVFQEVALAVEAVVVVGESTLDWYDFVIGLQWVWANKSVLEEALEYLDLPTLRDIHVDGFLSFSLRPVSDALRVLRLTKKLQCCDSRDRLFAVRGLLEPDVKDCILPDYTKSVEETYVDFTIRMICESGCLDILKWCSSQSSSLNLPSWVPNYSLSADSSAMSEFSRASGLSFSEIQLKTEHILEAQGFHVAAITQVSSSIKRAQTNLEIAQTCSRWWSAVEQNTAVNDNYPPDSFFEALSLGHLRDILPQIWGGTISLQEWKNAFDAVNRAAGIDLEETAINEIGNEMRNFLDGRAFFDTGDRVFGVGPEIMAVGDIIVVLLGCNTPLVLRPQPHPQFLDGGCESYLVIGECYVPNHMNAEALLGPFPSGWTQHNIRVDGENLIAFTDGKVVTQRDPRTRLPEGWQYIFGPLEERKIEEDLDRGIGVGVGFLNVVTDESTAWDPSLTAEILRERGVKVKRFELV